MRQRKKHKSKKQHSRDDVSEKISVLRHEGTPEKQAVAMAINMKREGRLGPHGEYRRAKKRKSHRK